MTMSYYYNKAVNIPRLRQEILNSTVITKALDNIGGIPNVDVEITFREELPADQKIALDNIIVNHQNIPLPENKADLVSAVEYPDLTWLSNFPPLYQIYPIILSIPAATGIYTSEVSFNYPILILGGTVEVTSNMIGDICSFIVGYETLVGVLTADASINSTEIEVSNDVLNNVCIGYTVKLSRNSTIVNVGSCWGKTAHSLKLESPLTQNFYAGDLVYTEFMMVKPYTFGLTTELWLGRDTVRGSKIPPNSRLLIEYNNVTGTAKNVQWVLQYYL